MGWFLLKEKILILFAEKKSLEMTKKCSISYDILYQDIKVGGKILVDDGLLKFKVTGVEEKQSTLKS